jgi:hypothetical protein
MTKLTVVCLLSISLLASAAYLCARQPYGPHPLQKPGSSVVEIESVMIPASGCGTLCLHPSGIKARVGGRSVLVLKVFDFPQGGNGGAMAVYFQTSSDDGHTWTDLAGIQPTGPGTWYIPVSAVSNGSSTVSPVNQSGLSNAAKQGPFGDRIRMQYFGAWGPTIGTYSFQGSVILD